MKISILAKFFQVGDKYGGREIIKVDKGNQSKVTIVSFSANPRDCIPMDGDSEVLVERDVQRIEIDKEVLKK